MTDPYVGINATKIDFFDNELGAVRTLTQLSDGTYITNIATGAEVTTGTNNTKLVTPKAIGDAGAWTAWIPNIISGAAKLSGYTIARYCKKGKILFFEFIAVGKNLSGTAGSIYIEFPFVGVLVDDFYMPITIYNGTTVVLSTCLCNYNEGIFEVFKTAAAGSWVANETGISIFIKSFYEI